MKKQPLRTVPVERKQVPCIFDHNALAVGKYSLSKGCVCKSETRQDLCSQHVISAEPLGSMELICIYDPEFYHRFGFQEKAAP
jgi:hypothetical protein